MRLALKKYPDGRLRPYWYGILQRAGGIQVRTLCRIAAAPPASLEVNDPGDAEFEQCEKLT